MSRRKEVSFTVAKFDAELIQEIAERAVAMARKARIDYDKITAVMDLTATHANGNPLQLRKLLEAEDFDFSHDVFGIRRHLNRETGELESCFRPRCSVPEGVEIINT